MTKKKDCGCNKKSPIVTFSTPDGKKFNPPYPMENVDTTYNEHYFDTNRNEAYGNTSLNPPNIFSKLDSSEAICARIDDKIMRIKNKGLVSATEDTLTDLIGYLLLLKMSMKK